MSKQNKRNQALIKAVEMAARIDPSLFLEHYPTTYCSEPSKETGYLCTRKKDHSGPHVVILDWDERMAEDCLRIEGKPWFTATKRSKSKRKQ